LTYAHGRLAKGEEKVAGFHRWINGEEGRESSKQDGKGFVCVCPFHEIVSPSDEFILQPPRVKVNVSNIRV
jgi:hypothetical protein